MHIKHFLPVFFERWTLKGELKCTLNIVFLISLKDGRLSDFSDVEEVQENSKVTPREIQHTEKKISVIMNVCSYLIKGYFNNV